MSHVPREKQVRIIHSLLEGASVRSTERLLDVHRDTVLRLMVRVGNGAANLLDEKMRDLPCRRLELDELWSFVGKKQRHIQPTDEATQVGDVWTYIAIDPETKVVPSFLCAKRDYASTYAFVSDLASRLRYRVQISTDALAAYRDAIGRAFADVDYAIIVKEYEAEPTGPGRYSPPRVSAIEKIRVYGAPVTELVSTSYVENRNLHLRMGVRRYTRLVNSHSKKWENHAAMTAVHFAYYNLVKQHSSIRCTPAMAIGVEQTAWTMEQLVEEALAHEPKDDA
jgi:hypothetical protein